MKFVDFGTKYMVNIHNINYLEKRENGCMIHMNGGKGLFLEGAKKYYEVCDKLLDEEAIEWLQNREE